MGLAIRHKKGRCLPALLCDRCEKPIKDLDGAIVKYKMSPDGGPSHIMVCHKGQCDRPRWVTEMRDELSDYLPWLIWNHNWGERTSSGKGRQVVLEVPEPIDV